MKYFVFLNPAHAYLVTCAGKGITCENVLPRVVARMWHVVTELLASLVVMPLGQEDPLVENGEAVLVIIFTLLLVCLVMHFFGGGKIGGLQLEQDNM